MANFNNRSVSQHQFAMVPRAEVPRSRFTVEHAHKTTFDAGYLIPVLVKEVLPGDHIQTRMTSFCRMSTPLFPVMDNFHLDSHFFFVPNRIVWDNWVKMMGERRSPNDSIDYTVPQLVAPAAEEPFQPGSIFDYMGLPVEGQLPANNGKDLSVNALPYRAYCLIWNEWFRDQNLQLPFYLNNGQEVPVTSDGPDYVDGGRQSLPPRRRGKRHDYFTSALPWPLKGGVDVTMPLAGTAPIAGLATDTTGWTATQNGWENAANNQVTYAQAQLIGDSVANPAGAYFVVEMRDGIPGGTDALPNIRADLSQATGATVNALRLAIATQQLLELDARGGTRYVETLRAHFGVTPQDYRLQRPEYLGGGSSRVNITPVAQTSETGDTPLGATGAFGTGVAQHSFSYAVPEHGFIIGLVSVRADLTYQQGLNKMWTRRSRYDYYWPVFANLGEQAITRGEIYFTNAVNGDDDLVFGYQERWAEYRYYPSMITGYFRSTTTGNIDEWHAAQYFTSPPTLGAEFIQDNPPMERILAAGEAAENIQFIGDFLFSSSETRALPLYSRPGLTRF